jgi:hypothetical protein
MSPKLIRKLHRWLGLAFSISVLMASGSGVLHNVMTRTQAPPPQAKPSGGGMDVKAIQISVADAVAKLGRRDMALLLVGADQGRTAYRAELEKRVRARGLEGIVRVVDRVAADRFDLMLARFGRLVARQHFDRQHLGGHAFARRDFARDRLGQRRVG